MAERELKVIQQRLGIPPDNCSVNRCDSAIGPGNTVHVRATWGEQSEVFTGFGAPKISAESVAEESVKQAERFLQSGAVVGEHLADQLLLPLALARGGSFVTTQPSEHTRTNARIIREFLETDIGLHSEESGRWIVEVEGRKTS